MEGLPTVMSVVNSGGGGGGGGQDNLAFAVSEENGLNYGYIIHLPVDVAMQQEILAVGNVLTQQEHLIVHQEQVETKHVHQQSTIYLPVVTTSTSNNCGDTNTVVHHQSSSQNHHHHHHHHHHHPPIEFQYHLEEIPSSAFIDGQVQVEMSAEVDVKYDTLNFTSVQLQHEQLANEQVNFEHDLVSEILSDNLPSSIVNPADQQNSQVKPSNSPLISKPIPTPTTTAKTYGKPKPVKIISEDLSQKISQETKSSSSSSSPLKVTKINQVSVKQTQRVSLPIPPAPPVTVRKRRLILDAQKQIPIPEFKRQLLNTKDIVSVRIELAPGTKQAMKCLEHGSVVQFFSTPGRAIRNAHLSRLFTNHLVMITNSVGHCSTASNSFNNVVPLNAFDLRVPSVLNDQEENSNFSKGHNTFSNVPSTAYKRLINASRPLDCLFKGLRKAPVFKEYKKIQRKYPEKMNGSSSSGGGGGGCGLKTFHNRQKNKVKMEKDKIIKDKQNKVEVKVEEVVYTVVEEEGESVVLKSSHLDEDIVSSDQGHHDPLLLGLHHQEEDEGGLKKGGSEVDNVFSDCASSFSMVNGEENDDNCGEDDLNKFLWSEHSVVTSS